MDATTLDDAELIDQVTIWAARTARGEAVLTDLIGELDAREAWAVHGVSSCAYWQNCSEQPFPAEPALH